MLLTAFQLLSHPLVFVLLLQNPGPILLVPMFHGLGTLGELTPRLRAGGSVSIARVFLGLLATNLQTRASQKTGSSW